MDCVLKGCRVYQSGQLVPMDILIRDGRIAEMGPSISDSGIPVYRFHDAAVLPGLVDVHVHLREPGFSYKATVATETRAAAHGGFTTICAMPNLKPVPDCPENLEKELEIIRRDAVVKVVPYGSITVGEKGRELSDMEGMAKDVVAFSDDGVGVQEADMMRAGMLRAKALNKLVVAHCEVNSLLRPGGCIHDGDYAREHNHVGISSESEWKEIERDINLAEETGCGYHVCHISTKESVALVRAGKARGVNVTCEVGPHYLLMSDRDLQEDGRFKMNPPLRSLEDREALVAGIKDGTIDMVITDHAPHSAEEKSRGLDKSLMGVVGLETVFPLLYTYLVEKGVIPLERLMELMCFTPARRFGLEAGLTVGQSANLAVWDLNDSYTVDPETFLSAGRATPFKGWQVKGRCLLTIAGGKVAYGEAPQNA